MTTRTRKPSHERRQELMAAAATLFAERGYDATRVSDIVAAVGVSQATFFWYFPTKEHILVAMMEEMVDELVRLAVEMQRAGLSARERILALVAKTFELFVPRLELVELFHRRLSAEELYRAQSEILNRLLDGLAGIIAEGVAKGEIEAPSPHITALLIVQMIHGASEATILPGAAEKHAALDRVLAASQHFIAKALAPQPRRQQADTN